MIDPDAAIPRAFEWFLGKPVMFVVLCKRSEKRRAVSRRAAAVRRSESCCSPKGVPHLAAGGGNRVLLRLPPSDGGSRAKRFNYSAAACSKAQEHSSSGPTSPRQDSATGAAVMGPQHFLTPTTGVARVDTVSPTTKHHHQGETSRSFSKFRGMSLPLISAQLQTNHPFLVLITQDCVKLGGNP